LPFASPTFSLTISQIVGPQVYFAREGPEYHTGLYVDIGCWSILFCLALSMGMYIKNRKKVQRRIALGLHSDIQDMSIMNTEDAMAYRIALTEMSSLEGFDLSLSFMRMLLMI